MAGTSPAMTGKEDTMTDIRVPTLGESVTEATIGKWFKKPGDQVAVDEPLVELETDKVTIEVPAPAAGVLADVAAKDGDTVAVGALLGQIKDGAGAAPAPKTAAPPPEQKPAPLAPAKSAAPDTAPSVRRLSAEQFRDALTTLTGIGYSSPAAEITASESEQKRFALPIPVHWIWNDPHAAEKAKPGHLYFRKTIQLAARPEDATAVVVCDNSFTLFVNGHEIGSGNEFKTAFLFDLRPWLKPGDNTFAVHAVNHLPDNSPPKTPNAVAGTENPAGLLFYARLRHVEKGMQKTNDFASDSSWICSEQKQDKWEKPEFAAENWSQAVKLGDMGMLPWRVTKVYVTTKLAAAYPGKVRASLVAADPLLVALGRPNREQVVTTRPTVATTLQALEMTNGETLADIIKRGAESLMADPMAKGDLVGALYEKALGRRPSGPEQQEARIVVGQPVQEIGVEDLLWAVTMLPEFQLIY